MDKLITFQNTEEVHRIIPTESHQVVYFNQTYALIETGIVVFRNGIYQVNDKDFFFLNRNGKRMSPTDKFVIGVCFYQAGTTFQTLLQDNDYIVFKFAVLSPRVMDYDRITNMISEHYQRQIEVIADGIYDLRQLNAQTNSDLSDLSTSTETTLSEHAASIGTNGTNISTIQSTLVSISDTLGTLSDTVSGLSDDLSTLTTNLESLTQRVTVLEENNDSGSETPVEPSEPSEPTPEEPSEEEPTEQEP